MSKKEELIEKGIISLDECNEEWSFSLEYFKSDYKNIEYIEPENPSSNLLLWDFESGKLSFVYLSHFCGDDDSCFYHVHFRGYGYGPGGDDTIRHIWFGNVMEIDDTGKIGEQDGYLYYPHVELLAKVFAILTKLEDQYIFDKDWWSKKL